MDPNEDFFVVLADDWTTKALSEEKLGEIIDSNRGRPIMEMLRAVEREALAQAVGGLSPRFDTMVDAELRATELAKGLPGTRFYVAQIDRYAYFQGAKIHRLGIPF